MLRLIAAAVLALAPVTALAAEIGEDGLHKQPWFEATFKDMAEDLETAAADGKRLVVFFEQRGCIYCTKMHEEVFSDPEVAAYIEEHYYAVQMNLFGDEEVTDFDGEAMSEKDIAARWGVLFTPTILFMPEDAPDGPAGAAAVAQIPGAFGRWTTLHMLQWVNEKGYEGDEHFQKYHARKFNARQTQ